MINNAIPRLEKAFKLIEDRAVVLLDNKAVVHGNKKYMVDYINETCTCEDHVYRNTKCKHIWAVILKLQQLHGVTI